MAGEDVISLFTGIGLSEQKAKETVKNATITDNLSQVINEARKHANIINKDAGNPNSGLVTKLVNPTTSYFTGFTVFRLRP